MWFWLFLIVLSFALHKFVVKPFLFWKGRGVPHENYIPLVGGFLPLLLRKKSLYDLIEDTYKHFPNYRYNGFYQMITPNLLLRDLDLIKQIGIKDFDHFVDHQATAAPEEVLFSRNLFTAKGNDWRQMRALLSPAFTSSKMKLMHGLISDCAQRLVEHYKHSTEFDGRHVVDVELKDLFTKYTNDVIATCAFGLECDSVKDPTNKFYLMGKDATSFEGIKGIKVMLANFAPGIFRLFKTTIFTKQVSDFFIGMIKDTIAYREENKLTRPDVIHLLLEARKGKLQHRNEEADHDDGFAVVEESELGKQQVQAHLSDVDIAGQAFVFFFAGFETSSTLLSFAASELAIYPDVQGKLIREIDNVMDACENNPSYEDILKMKYLDMVVSETLRKWPPVPSNDRKCTKDYTITASNDDETPLHVKTGDFISIPVYGIHRDPAYFPNPTCFDPERFSDANKHKIVPYSYMPFGIGPRACIGSRFALLEAKILLVHMLRAFELVVIEKTCAPLKLSTKTIRIQPDNGFWIGMKKR